MQVKTGYLAVDLLAGFSNGTQEGIAEFTPQCRRREGCRHVRVLFSKWKSTQKYTRKRIGNERNRTDDFGRNISLMH